MKKTPILLFGSLLAVSLCACGQQNSSNEVISIAIVADSSEETTINSFIRGYRSIAGNERKQFKIVKMTQYDDYIFNSTLYSEMPDIIQAYDYNCEYYANADLDGYGNSLFVPITSFMSRDGIGEEDFYPSIIEMTKCKTGSDEMYWVPRDYNKVVCAYNKDIFDAAGVDYPKEGWKWSDFVSTLTQLWSKSAEIKNGYSRSSIFYPVDMNLGFPAVYYPILKSYGAELIETSTSTCFGDSEEKLAKVKNAWDKLISLVDGVPNPDPEAAEKDKKMKLAAPMTQSIPFTNKQAAMMFMVRPNLSTYVRGLGEDAIDFVSLPEYDDLPSGSKSYIGMGCTGYGITTSCPESKRDAAWDFLKYIISKHGQNVFSESGNGIPCLRSLATDPDAAFKQYMVSETNHPNHDVFIDHEDRDIPMNFMKGFHTTLQLKIYQYIKDRTLTSFINATDRDGYYNIYKSELEKIWSK